MNWLGMLIQQHVSASDSVLSLGCGIMAGHEGLQCKSFLGVDIYEPYIDFLKKKGVNCLLADITTMELKPDSYDVVLALDVFEHIAYNKAISLVKRTKLAARKKVIAYTPREFHDNVTENDTGRKFDVLKWLNEDAVSPYKGFGINPFQEHRSLIEEPTLQRLGFITSTDNPSHNVVALWTKQPALESKYPEDRKGGHGGPPYDGI